jgi:hypothetical protein
MHGWVHRGHKHESSMWELGVGGGWRGNESARRCPWAHFISLVVGGEGNRCYRGARCLIVPISVPVLAYIRFLFAALLKSSFIQIQSLIGCVADCDSGCHGFKSHYPPHLPFPFLGFHLAGTGRHDVVDAAAANFAVAAERG